jgi:hypothetical protein
VRSNVDSLVADLERAIAEADAFAQQMDADAKKYRARNAPTSRPSFL